MQSVWNAYGDWMGEHWNAYGPGIEESPRDSERDLVLWEPRSSSDRTQGLGLEISRNRWEARLRAALLHSERRRQRLVETQEIESVVSILATVTRSQPSLNISLLDARVGLRRPVTRTWSQVPPDMTDFLRTEGNAFHFGSWPSSSSSMPSGSGSTGEWSQTVERQMWERQWEEIQTRTLDTDADSGTGATVGGATDVEDVD